MGEITDQLPIGLLLLDQSLFAASRQLLFYGLELEQETSSCRVLDRSGVTVQFRCSGSPSARCISTFWPV